VLKISIEQYCAPVVVVDIGIGNGGAE